MADQPPRHIICGLSELSCHSRTGVTHIVSILDPDMPEPAELVAYPPHARLTLRFHDIIAPRPGMVAPEREHVDALLDFGRQHPALVLVHCHAGISRSTAAAAALLLQADPQAGDDAALAQMMQIRPQAWPNSRIVALADALLGRGGRLNAALGRFYRWRLGMEPEIGELLRQGGRGDEVDMARDAMPASHNFARDERT